MADLTGRTLGPYNLTRKLGQGGMGAVYVGVHRVLQTSRAIKVLLPNEVDEGVVERFMREGVISASLRHPNIVQIFDVGEDDGHHFLVMELVDGQSLLPVLRNQGALPLDRCVHLLRQVADALDYAHGRGIVHRDIKPSNIIVEPNDNLTLIDFGIARALDESRLTRAGVVVGTFEYMAPEVVTQGGGSPGADRYSLGIVAYQMLTGRAPFIGESAHSVMYRQVHDPVPPPSQFRPDIPPAFEQAIVRQLSKSPDDRFPTTLAWVDALAAALKEQAAEVEAQATSIAEITRGGFARPTPGSGQTPFPRPARSTSVAPAARVAPAVTPPPVVPLPMANPRATSAADASPYRPPTSHPPVERGAESGSGRVLAPDAPAAKPARSVAGLIVGILAILVVVAAAGYFLLPQRRNAAVSTAQNAGVTPPVLVTTSTVTPPVPAQPQASPAAPAGAAQPQPQVQPQPQQPPASPVAAAPDPAAAQPPPGPPPTLTPARRLEQAREASAAGNHAVALRLLTDLASTDPSVSGLVDAQYDVHMAFAQALMDQGNFDGSFDQFGDALKVRPGDEPASSGQQRIILSQQQAILTKNYAIMEESWEKAPELAIKALEENFKLNANFRETRQKLYSLLIAKADRQLQAGERDAAFPVLMRALEVMPDGGLAQQKLVTFTPTPTPEPTLVPTAVPVYRAPTRAPTGGGGSNTGGGGSSTGGGGSSTGGGGGGGNSACPNGFCP